MLSAAAVPCLRRRNLAKGSTTLLLTASMLLLVAATTLAGLQFLLASRQVTTYQLEQEIAFRAAETALLDAEAELMAALSNGASGVDARLAAWPPPGQCGTGPQRGLCRPAPNMPPPWVGWLDSRRADEATGIAMGTFSGVTLPALPPERLAREPCRDTLPSCCTSALLANGWDPATRRARDRGRVFA